MNGRISDFGFLISDLLVCDASLNEGLSAQPSHKSSIKNRQSTICTELSHGTI